MNKYETKQNGNYEYALPLVDVFKNGEVVFTGFFHECEDYILDTMEQDALVREVNAIDGSVTNWETYKEFKQRIK